MDEQAIIESIRSGHLKGYGTDVKIMLSGSAGSKDGGDRGVVLVSGDMVVSGTLYGSTGTRYIKDANVTN